MSEAIPVQLRRGVDSQWWEERGSWTAVHVLAPCDVVAKTLSGTRDVQRLVRSAFDPQLRIAPNEVAKVIVVYQLKGHKWTLIHAIGNMLYEDVGEVLSKKLDTAALVYGFQDTVDVAYFTLYDNGKERECYSSGSTVSFEDSNRAENIAAGWVSSDDNLRHFKSERRRGLDLNSPAAADLPNRTAIDFDLYAPADVWEVDRSGRVRLAAPWVPQDIQEALVVLAKG